LQATVPFPPSISVVASYKIDAQVISNQIVSYLNQMKNIKTIVKNDRTYDVTLILAALDPPPNSEIVTNNM